VNTDPFHARMNAAIAKIYDALNAWDDNRPFDSLEHLDQAINFIDRGVDEVEVIL
jgi:hypothetical protein